MSYALTFPLNRQLSTGHYGKPKGTTGRSGHGIAAICLHVLESPIETYLSYLQTNIGLADVRPGTHGSVHYGVSADGTLHQFVLDTNTAWGVSQLSSPTWDLLNNYVGIDPDYYLLHVGVERYLSSNLPTLMFRGLADLVAYLCGVHDIEIDADHIISHDQLDSNFDECAPGLATNLIATVLSLTAAGNQEASVNVAVLAQQVAALDTRLSTLEDEVEDSLETIETYAAHVTTNAGTSTLGHVKASSTLAVNGSTGVATVTQNAAAAKIASGTQTVVADIAAICQFPTTISDALSWITAGVNYKFTPSVAGLYRLKARLQFSAATWTAGKYIQLDVYKNGTLMETIGYRVIEANLTSKIVEIQGECEFLQSTLTDSYQVKVLTDDSNGAKTIAAGSCFVERVGA